MRARMMQRFAACTLALTMLAGCSRPAAPPVTEQAAREHPSVQTPPPAQTAPAPSVPSSPSPFTAGSGCADRSGKPPTADVGSLKAREGICQGFIHADATTVLFRLPPAPPEQVIREALRLEGAGSPQLTFWHTARETYLSVRLPPGAPGEEVRVLLDGAVGEGGATHTLGFRLKRLITPQITTEVRIEGGSWQPLQPGATLPRKPLELRLSLVGEPKADRVEFAVQEALRQKGHTRRWEDANHLLISIPEPPPSLFFAFDWLEAGQGLNVLHSSIGFFTGQAPPRLVALDPVSGREKVLGDLPVDVQETSLSPDGNWAALIALDPAASQHQQVWLVNTNSGERHLTEFDVDPFSSRVLWLSGERMLLPSIHSLQVWDLRSRTGKRSESAGSFWGPLSPDQHNLAGWTVDMDREDPQSWLAPASIVLVDLTAMTEQVYPDITRARVPHKSAPPWVHLAWEDDSRRLRFEELLPPDPENPSGTPSRWRSLDLTGGTVGDSAEPPEGRKQPTPTKSAAGWEYKPSSWGQIALRSPDGKESTAGAGLPIGWSAGGQLLLIRWENYPYRRILMMP